MGWIGFAALAAGCALGSDAPGGTGTELKGTDLDVKDGIFGETTIATLTRGRPIEGVDVMLDVVCLKEGSVIHEPSLRFGTGDRLEIPLGPTERWTGGGATCTAVAFHFDKHGRERELAQDDFAVTDSSLGCDVGDCDAGTGAADAGTGAGDAGTGAGDREADGGVEPPPPPPVASEGIWISHEELMELPTSGPAWDALKAAADGDAGTPNLSDQDQMNNVYVLAKALVYARTGTEHYRTEVREAIMGAIGTEDGGRTLALGRELAAYVIAADLVGLSEGEDETFRSWLREVRHEDLSGRTLVSTHEDRPNNWGTHAGASRVAVAIYLGDEEDLERAAQVFRGWLGDRSAYSDFKYGDDLSWQADADNPVGINAAGATKDGESIDGAQPEEMRRGCSFQFPPCETGYAWEGLQGAIAQAEMLWRQGYDAWAWEDRALLRAARFMQRLQERYPGDDWWAEGDDQWQPWLLNHAYGTDLPAEQPARPGKNMGWTDWTHNPASRPRE